MSYIAHYILLIVIYYTLHSTYCHILHTAFYLLSYITHWIIRIVIYYTLHATYCQSTQLLRTVLIIPNHTVNIAYHSLTLNPTFNKLSLFLLNINLTHFFPLVATPHHNDYTSCHFAQQIFLSLVATPHHKLYNSYHLLLFHTPNCTYIYHLLPHI